MSADLAVHARRVLLPGGAAPATVVVSGDSIGAVLPYGSNPEARSVRWLDDDAVLLPGLVDCHVHVNEPGRTEWEGFATATRAAAAGGVTTLVDMPLNSLPPTVDAASLQVKRAAARGQMHVDVGFWAGAVPGNTGAFGELVAAGAFGFKCFLTDSGVAEFPPLDADGLEEAMRAAARLDVPLLVHAEHPGELATAPALTGRGYPEFLRSRPARAETAAIFEVIDAVRRTGARAHIVHLSAADALPAIASARAEGLPLTVETCPHYLALAAEDVPPRGTEFKCCPPIREAANRDRLWEGLLAGHIDAVVSDHSPCPPELKGSGEFGGDFAAAWGGVSSLQLGLPVTWTSARERGVPLGDVVRWMAAAPAEIVGLQRRKGRIEPGLDADLVEFAPDEEFVVEPERLHHRHPLTPYAGQKLAGVVRRTWLRGRLVDGAHPRGELVAW